MDVVTRDEFAAQAAVLERTRSKLDQLEKQLAELTEQLTTNNQQPTTNNQQPTTNNQQPTTNNQQPTTNNQQHYFIHSSKEGSYEPRHCFFARQIRYYRSRRQC
jgi:hypothetical protein